ncbi:low molecular weight phosphotyrosine protein phosphatase [Lysobacter silvisoli]|uniref:protein-tyrosine-phosphatase n=1 Tax=Lysobacter silvisoli TaxID=2293254 RepID=A0A371K0G9_9GAMM|nr:low molecular weight phosphotyrosine protein phosphatase [Lysobacter silvisoli]
MRRTYELRLPQQARRVRILIVCRGNLCRSPMAAVLLRHALPAARIESAGLAAVAGAPIEPHAQRALARLGLSDDGHRARQFSLDALAAADLVLAMEQRHIAALLALAPAAQSKCELLSRWLDHHDIDDPYGRSQAQFDEICARIEACVRAWTPKLQTDARIALACVSAHNCVVERDDVH